MAGADGLLCVGGPLDGRFHPVSEGATKLRLPVRPPPGAEPGGWHQHEYRRETWAGEVELLVSQELTTAQAVERILTSYERWAVALREIEHPNVGKILTKIAGLLDMMLNGSLGPAGKMGFLLLVFPMDRPFGGMVRHVSNSKQADIRAGLKEILAQMEGMASDAPRTLQ